jgi:hypothetical protein
MKEEIEKIKDQMHIMLSASLSKFVGKKSGEIDLKKFTGDVLKSIENMNEVSWVDVKQVEMMWKIWNVWQKLVWFFMNKMGFGRKEIENYELALSELVNDDGDDTLYVEYKAEHKKYWYEDAPKSVICTEFTMRMSTPAECIKIEYPIEV